MTTKAQDVIAKLQTDLLSILPSSQAERTTINVLAGILTVTADELAPMLEKKIDVDTLVTGIGNVESGIALMVQGGEEIAKALKGPATTPTTEGNA